MKKEPESSLTPVCSPKVVPMPAFGLCVFESRHAPGFIGKLQDDFAKFFLVLAGNALWRTESAELLLGPNSFVHVPAGMAHTQEDKAGAPVTLYAIHYRPQILSLPVQSRLNEGGIRLWTSLENFPGSSRLLRTLFQEMLFEQRAQKEGWEMLLAARLLDLVVRALRLSTRTKSEPEIFAPPDSDGSQRLAHYLTRQKSQFYRQETLDEAAHSVGMSRRKFTGLFKQIVGVTWLEHRLKLRLQHARQLLRETDNSILAVSFEAGFEDLSNFHRAFKSAFACTPKAYRETSQRSPGRVLDHERNRSAP